MKAALIVALLTVVVASPLSDTHRFTTLRPELIPSSTSVRYADSSHGGAERICDTISYYEGLGYFWYFPDRFGTVGYATIFSVGPSMACTLKTIRVAMHGTRMRGSPELSIGLWSGTSIPLNKLDSALVPHEQLDSIEVDWINVLFSGGPWFFKNKPFFISCEVVGEPGDSLAILSDPGASGPDFGPHSLENWQGLWGYIDWGWGARVPYFLMEVDACCYETCCNHDGIRGDANSDNNINVADVTFLVDYLFNDALAPDCDEESDANGSGETDISDLTHLVDYLFNDGQPPQACP